MRYDLPVYRPPSEAFSLIIQTTIGCPHNKCRFCFMYKEKKFSIRKVEDIKEDITSARMEAGGHVRTIFFADGNSIIMRTPQLVDILNYCYAMFPYLERVTSYGAAKFILKTKSVEELKQLKKAGFTRIHMGLESGDDSILSEICKGSTSEEMIAASNMIKQSGMELSQYVLLGIAGAEGYVQHAERTAEVLNAMDPDFIRLRTLVLRPGAPLFDDWKAGEFIQSSPIQVLEETKIILENLSVDSQFLSDHVSNYANINGRLPEDKKRMLTGLDAIMRRLEEDSDFAARMSNPNRCLHL